MNRNTLERRIAKMEVARAPLPFPNVIIATRCIPDRDMPVTQEVIQRWLHSGMAHLTFGGRAVFYDEGRPEMTSEEWQAKYSPEMHRES